MHWLTGKMLEKFSEGQKFGLDIGCGQKKWNQWYRCKHVGIDIYKESKADILAAGFALPFKNNTFDFINMFSVLEYIEQDELVLKEIHRVLKPSGRLLLISQNKRATEANIRSDPSKAKLHKHIYTLANIHRKLKSHSLFPINYKHPILFCLGLYYHLTSVYFFTLAEARKPSNKN